MLRRHALLLVLAVSACGATTASVHDTPDPLVGAWHAYLTVDTGALTTMTGLEFLYAFNQGGTMTESSNYDGAPPVPPAYGTWHRTAGDHYEVRYTFFTTQAPASLAAITKGGGWQPAGRGTLVETLTLAPDARSFTSSITYELYDRAGKRIEGGGTAHSIAKRL